MNTVKEADAKKKTDFWHTEAFQPWVLIRVRLVTANIFGMEQLEKQWKDIKSIVLRTLAWRKTLT